MTITPSRTDTRLSLGEVDPWQPLNYNSPLTEGLEGLWLPLPHLTGGSRLYDLSGYGRHASLSSDEGRPEWRSSPSLTSPFLEFDGDSDRVDGGDDILDASAEWSFWGWIRSDGNSSGNTAFGIREPGSSDFVSIGATTSDTLKLLSNGETPGSGSTLADGWEFVGARYDGSEIDVLLNGKVDYTLTPSGSNWESATHLIVGVSVNTGAHWSGGVGTIGVHQRYIDNFFSLYHQARRGFSSLLRRRDQSALYVSAAGAVTVSASLNGESGSLGSDIAVVAALSEALSGAPGTLTATIEALPALEGQLQGNAGTLASGISTIAAVEAAMTGEKGALVSEAKVLAALNAGTTGAPGTLNAQLSTSTLNSIEVALSGSAGNLSSNLTAQIALDLALQGSAGNLSADVGVPLSLDGSFAGARGDLAASVSVTDTAQVQAALSGQAGTLTGAAKVLARLQAALQGAAGSSQAVADVTAALQASLQGEPGQLAAIIGEPPTLARIDATLTDALSLDATLGDSLTLDAELTD